MRKHICTREKAITIILSFAMIVGLLGGMKLDVRAKERTIDLASYIKDHLGETIDLGTISGDSSIKAEVTYDMGLCYMDGVLVDKRKDDYSDGAAGNSKGTVLNGISNPGGVMSLDLNEIKGIDPQLTYSMQIYGWKDGERYDNAYHIFLYLSIITIDTLNITVTQPEAGQPLPTVENRGVNVTEGAEVTEVKWGVNIGGRLTEVANGVKAEYNTQYVLNVWVKAKDGYKFGDRVVYDATINGERNGVSSGVEKGTLWFSKYFPKTASDPAKTINSVNIEIDPPVAGQPLATACKVLTGGVSVIEVKWQAGVENVTGQVAHEGTVYKLRVYLKPEVNYNFGSSVQTIVNSTTGSFDYGLMCVYHELTATGSEPSSGDYKIIEGNDSNYVPGSNKPLSFRGDGDYDKFLRVDVDRSPVTRTDYTVSSGSTIITFKPNYLATLSNGPHTIEMFWNVNGAEKSATGSFYIGKKSEEVVPGNTGTTQPANNTESKPRHVCSFEWVITLDPTTGADGLEEYKCTGCGVVQESHPIPASVAVVKDFYGKVKEAPEKGSITYDSGKLYTISDYILKKMAERNDVAVTVKFEYQNKKYQIIFPAGLDYSAVLNDEETMYGYFGAAAKLGLKVTGQ